MTPREHDHEYGCPCEACAEHREEVMDERYDAWRDMEMMDSREAV